MVMDVTMFSKLRQDGIAMEEISTIRHVMYALKYVETDFTWDSISVMTEISITLMGAMINVKLS